MKSRPTSTARASLPSSVVNSQHLTVKGEGNGPIDALMNGLRNEMDVKFKVRDYSEHALTAGSEATAVAYVEAEGDDGGDLVGRGDEFVDPRRVPRGRWSRPLTAGARGVRRYAGSHE